MKKYASEILAQAIAWLGLKESDGSHKKIIDTYNGHKPLARGYKVKYTDSWCATFVSAVAIACGYTDIIPTECGCQKMIELFKKLGCWVEADGYVPKPGDVLFYDWNDNGKGDCTGWSDHVGYVEKVEGDTITLIEGNLSNCVKRCTLKVNGRYIRGYGVPRYDPEPTEAPEKPEEKPVDTTPAVTSGATYPVNLPTLKKGSKGDTVKALQILLIGWGYSCGSSGVDGSFGGATDKAMRSYQAAKGLEVDGKCGPKTWGKLLGA